MYVNKRWMLHTATANVKIILSTTEVVWRPRRRVHCVQYQQNKRMKKWWPLRYKSWGGYYRDCLTTEEPNQLNRRWLIHTALCQSAKLSKHDQPWHLQYTHWSFSQTPQDTLDVLNSTYPHSINVLFFFPLSVQCRLPPFIFFQKSEEGWKRNA